MSLWILLLYVCAAGAVGGIVNVLISDQGIQWPGFGPANANQIRIFRPGFVGNVFTGAIAAGISWGIYGPFAGSDILGPAPATSGLTLASLGGGVLVGIAGARWLTNEVDKKLLKAAASEAAGKAASADAATRIAASSPEEALRIVREDMP